MLPQTLTMLAVLAVAGCVLLAVALLAFRSGVWTIALLLGVWIATTALRDSVDLSLTIGSLRVTALDVLSVVLIVVGLSRLLSQGVGNLGRGLALLLFLLVALHIARGAFDFGLQTAINAARGWLYFSAALLYAAWLPGGWDRRIWRFFGAAGLLLAAISIPYLVVDGVHPATTTVFRDGAWITTRPLSATGALLILQAAILLPVLGWRSRQAAVCASLAAVGVVVVLQHRTVWIAALLVGVTGLLWWSNRRAREGATSGFAVLGVVLLLLPAAVWGFTRTGPLLTSVKEVTATNSTFTWRTTSWRELISSHHSPSDIVGGGPSGADWTRTINGQPVDLSPHDGFVDAYLRFGLPGVLILCWLGVLLWRRRAALGAGIGLTADAVALLLLTQLVFSVAYTLDSVQGLIAGAFVSGLAATSAARAGAPERPLRPRARYAVTGR